MHDSTISNIKKNHTLIGYNKKINNGNFIHLTSIVVFKEKIRLSLDIYGKYLWIIYILIWYGVNYVLLYVVKNAFPCLPPFSIYFHF